MQSNWENRSISQIGKVFNGNSINEEYKKTNYANVIEGIPFLATKDIGYDSTITYDNGVKIPYSQKDKFKIAPANTALICAEGGSAGRKYAITNQEVCFGNKLFALVPNDNVSSKYIYYYYQSAEFQKIFLTEVKGIIGGVSMSRFKGIAIPIPPFSEQQQIVKKLDIAFELIDRAKSNFEQNIQNAKELFQSTLNQVFSEKGEGENFELKKLSELGSITSSKRIYKSEYVSEGVPFYRTKELKELAHGKEISLELYITRERYVEIKNRFGVPQVGDILLSAVGTIGEILVIENENEFYFKDGNIVWFKDFRMVNPYYLRYLLITFVENIKNMAQGAAYSALTIEKINEYKVYFPKDLKIQQNIVEQLDILSAQTKNLQQKYQQKLVNLEELKKGILEKAFKGELI